MRTLQQIVKKVLKHGKSYIPDMLPEEIDRGRVGDCFDHTLVQALRHPKYKYVEGIAKRVNEDEWVLHAWLTDSVRAYDPTWGVQFEKGGVIYPLPTEYIGIAFPENPPRVLISSQIRCYVPLLDRLY